MRITLPFELNELNVDRVICFLISVGNPLVGIFIRIGQPESIDPLLHRVIVTVLFVTLFLSSFFTSQIRKRFDSLLFILYIILWTWVVYTGVLNNFSQLYIINLFITSAGVLIQMREMKKLIMAAVFILSILSFGLAFASSVSFFRPLFLFEFAAVCFSYVIVVGWKITIQEKLQARTQEVESINKVMIGRELTMIELKKEIAQLKGELQQIKQ